VRQDNFHHVTLTARYLVGERLTVGQINLNTTSSLVWRSLLETYNSVGGVPPIPVSSLNSRGTAIANGLATAASGKSANSPFLWVPTFGGSELLAENLPATVTPEEFMTAIAPLLAVRSDTFRLRVYGEAVNPVDPTEVEARAWAEAIVQRTAESGPGGNGRRFILRSFRWLSSDEI
jgi:hypothetical protein